LLENLYTVTGKVHPTRPIHRFQALLPLIRRQHLTRRGKNTRADLAHQSPPILDRRMLRANSAKAYGYLKAPAPSKLYGQAAIAHSADGCGDTG